MGLKWLPIGEALRLDLSDITVIVLREIEKRFEAGFGSAFPIPLFECDMAVSCANTCDHVARYCTGRRLQQLVELDGQ